MRERLDTNQVQILAVLTFVNFMNFLDRQVIGAVLPLLQSEFALNHTHAALLGTGFALAHAVFTLPLGMLADRTSRKAVMAFAVLFWSAATFLTGLATSFRSLLGARTLVGVGEAAFTPAATAIITRSFPASLRARAQGMFNAGMFIGGCAGLGIGGALASTLGWRTTLCLIALPGLALAWRIRSLPEPRLQESREPVPLRDLLRVPAFMAALVSGCFVTFAAYSFIFWGTTFVVSDKGFTLLHAGLALGATLGVGGVLGILAGAWLADRLMRLVPWGRVAVVAAGLILGIPCLIGAVHTAQSALFVGLFLAAAFFLSWYHGPLTAVLHDLTPERSHATAMGLYNAIVHLFAVTWAPLVIGNIADRWGLTAGMDVAAGAFIVGALGFVLVLLMMRRGGIQAARRREAALSPSVAPVVSSNSMRPHSGRPK